MQSIAALDRDALAVLSCARHAGRVGWPPQKSIPVIDLGPYLAGALRNRDTAPPPGTRMADFETWICSAESALGRGKGEFLTAYITPAIARGRSRPRLKRTRS